MKKLILIIFAIFIPAIAFATNNVVEYYHCDAQGTPVAISDDSGNVRWKSKALPFGESFTGVGATDSEIRYSGKRYNSELGLYDFGNRYYDASTGRFTGVDSVKGDIQNPQRLNSYAYCLNSPYKYIDPDGRDAVPIVFPDYKISTVVGKLPFLGHGGILLIDQNSGVTKYYQYGRYDKEQKGIIQNIEVPNVEVKNGEVSQESLRKVLSVISEKAGHNGKIAAVYIKNENFAKMNKFAEDWMKENDNPQRKPYSIWNRSCITFTKDVLESGGVNTPSMIDPRPNSYIGELKDVFTPLNYESK